MTKAVARVKFPHSANCAKRNYNERSSAMKYTIDRFEGDYALLEDENRLMKDILIKDLPDEAKEGDVLVKIGDSYSVDLGETERRKKKIQELADDLWE